MVSLQISAPIASDEGGVTRWQAELIDGERRQLLYFESDGFPAGEDRVPLRPFILAALPIAMRRGCPLQIPGSLDTGSYRNLIEWQQAMAGWHPGDMQVVPLAVDVSSAPPAAAESGAATAFSGGVDSCYTAVRYSQDDDCRRQLEHPLRAGIMVHGMDIPLAGQGATQFDAAFARSQRVLESLGLEALSVATNARDLSEAEGVNWNTAAHGILIASAIACFEARFAQVLIPSTYVYGCLRTPWASHPATDPLFSSSRVAYLHDGAEANKLDKVDVISPYPAVSEQLRVCWSGPRNDGNCGHCFKCVTTQACFWLAGVESPAAFDSPARVEELAAVPLTSEQNRYLLRYMQAAARERKRPDIADALARTLRRPANRWPKRYLRKKLKRALRGDRS
jgi:hypothetical protein